MQRERKKKRERKKNFVENGLDYKNTVHTAIFHTGQIELMICPAHHPMQCGAVWCSPVQCSAVLNAHMYETV